MCRLAFIPADAVVSRARLVRLFEYLESTCGGDGNGWVAVAGDGSEYQTCKSLELSARQAAHDVHRLKRQGYHCYFHTRKVSVGWLSDSQCHPHEVSGPAWDGYLCHNGTWSDGAPLARYLRVGSDTAALAHLLGRHDIDDLEKRRLFPVSGVFLLTGTPRGESSVVHRVLKLSGDLWYCPDSSIWASDFPLEWDANKPGLSVFEVQTGRHNLLKVAPKAPVKHWKSASCNVSKWPIGYDSKPVFKSSYPSAPAPVERGIVFDRGFE